MSAIGNNGARSSGPTGCLVPGCSGGCNGSGRWGTTLNHASGTRSDDRSQRMPEAYVLRVVAALGGGGAATTRTNAPGGSGGESIDEPGPERPGAAGAKSGRYSGYRPEADAGGRQLTWISRGRHHEKGTNVLSVSVDRSLGRRPCCDMVNSVEPITTERSMTG